MRQAFRFLTGAIIGGLIGLLVALLLAPASGEELRHQMRSRVAGLQAELKDAASARRAELERQLARLRQPRGKIEIEESMME